MAVAAAAVAVLRECSSVLSASTSQGSMWGFCCSGMGGVRIHDAAVSNLCSSGCLRHGNEPTTAVTVCSAGRVK